LNFSGAQQNVNQRDYDHESDDEEDTPGQRTAPSIVLASKTIRMCFFCQCCLSWLLAPDHTKESGRRVKAANIGKKLGYPKLASLIVDFLQQQGFLPPHSIPPPHFNPDINIYPSAKVTFYAPSDISSGPGGMCQELIRAVSTWRSGASRYDTVFLKLENGERGMRALGVARVRLFFTFHYSLVDYQCALVEDYILHGNGPDEDTGMWKVKRAIDFQTRLPISRVIYLKDILRASHLIPVFHGTPNVATHLTAEASLDHYRNKFHYVNKFVDYHAFETVF
jgi:hypothetical protein